MRILIAGASGGIGRYLTSQFDVEGNTLYLTYNKTRDNIYRTINASSIVYRCDFSNKENVENMFSQISELDVLINTMGHVENNLVSKMSEDEWDRVITSNLKTIFLSCKYGAPKIVEKGHIINISSVLGEMGMVGASNYAASKAAVAAFTKSFALECLKLKIFVNTISLGYFNVGLGLKLSENIHKIMSEKIPLKKFGEPEEIMNAVKYLISSQYMVGQVLHLNGGLT